jgi:hypothetical protein
MQTTSIGATIHLRRHHHREVPTVLVVAPMEVGEGVDSHPGSIKVLMGRLHRVTEDILVPRHRTRMERIVSSILVMAVKRVAASLQRDLEGTIAPMDDNALLLPKSVPKWIYLICPPMELWHGQCWMTMTPALPPVEVKEIKGVVRINAVA